MTNSLKDASEIASRLHRLSGLNQTQIDALSLSLDPVQVDQINDADLASLVNGTLPGLPVNPAGGLPLGLPGATQGARFVGGTVSGPPSTGSFHARDYVLDGAGMFWICTVGGSPGTWVDAAQADALSVIPTATAVKTGNYTAAANQLIPVDTTSGSVTVTLPTAPADKTRIVVKHVVQGGSNTVTVARGGSSDVFNKAGGSTSLALTYLNQAVTVQYKASGGIWYVVSDDIPASALTGTFVQGGATLAGAVAGNKFTIGPRSTVTTLPAASVRPVASPSQCAFDVMPTGSPTENPTEGFAWIDVCSTDIIDNNNATTCAHVGIGTSKAIFGSRGYGGSTAPNLLFEVGAGNSNNMTLDGSGTLAVSGSLSVPFIRKVPGQPFIDLRTSGSILLVANSATDKPLAVKAVASQSGDMFQVLDETGSPQIRITGGNSAQYADFVVGKAVLPTVATHGFLYIPSIAGTPASSPPTTYTGTSPICFDYTNNKLWLHNGTAWKSTTLA